MALIKCTECNKNFSDKSISCPECGCPTEIVLKALESPTTLMDLKQVSKEATNSMLKEVSSAKREADRALRLFKSRKRSLLMNASWGINLYAGNAMSRAVEMMSDSVTACNDLYVSYQSLVEYLDEVCRPLLAMQPEGKAIKAVRDLIQFLNEGSNIENNCDATLDGMSIGNVANSQYFPSVSNKMIQKFWEKQYDSSPYAREYERQIREQKEEEERKKREAEQKKREAARKKRETERKKREAERKKIEEEKAQSKIYMEKIEAEAEKMILDFKKQLDSEGNERIKVLQLQIEEKIQDNFRKIEASNKQLEIVSAFHFFERKRIVEEKKRLEEQANLLSSPEIISKEKSNIQKIISYSADRYSNMVKDYLANRFPYSKYGKRSTIVRNECINEYVEDRTYSQYSIPRMPNVQAIFDENMR